MGQQLKNIEEMNADNAAELTPEKSQQVASVIEMLKQFIPLVDLPYTKKLAETLIRQASRQRSMAILNPHYPESKNELLDLQGAALLHFVSFVEKMIVCGELKKKIGEDSEKFSELEKLFV